MRRMAPTLITFIVVVGGMIAVQPAWAAPQTLDVSPEAPEQELATDVTFTAAVTPAQAGVDIDFELFGTSPNDPDDGFFAPADQECTTAADGTCKVSITDAAAKAGEKDTIRAWIDADEVDNTVEADMAEGRDESVGGTPGNTPEPDNTDVVAVTWTAPNPVVGLDTELEQITALKNTDAHLVASVGDQKGTPQEGVHVGFVIDMGPGAGERKGCNTGNNGQCEVTFKETPSQLQPNPSRVRSWVDPDKDDFPDEADPAEGRNEKTDPGTNSEPDKTDVVEITWVDEINVLDVEPEESTPHVRTSQAYQVTVNNNVNQPKADQNVDFVVRTGPDRGAHDQCTTAADGTCSVSFTGKISGTDQLLFWIDKNGDDFADEADLSEGRNEQVSPGSKEPDQTDVVSTTWSAVCPGYGDSPKTQVVGTSGDDVLTGSSGSDIICGRGGNDALRGAGGNDLLLGGRGGDTLRGGPGNDTLHGGAGPDLLNGGSGEDRCAGGPGKDHISHCER